MVSECDIELMTMPPEKDLVQTELLSAMDRPDGGMEYRILVVAHEEDQLPRWSGFPVEIGGEAPALAAFAGVGIVAVRRLDDGVMDGVAFPADHAPDMESLLARVGVGCRAGGPLPTVHQVVHAGRV